MISWANVIFPWVIVFWTDSKNIRFYLEQRRKKSVEPSRGYCEVSLSLFVSQVSSPKEIIRQPSELHFDLTFIENTQSQEIGTIQINAIQGRAIPYRKGQLEIICKG